LFDGAEVIQRVEFRSAREALSEQKKVTRGHSHPAQVCSPIFRSFHKLHRHNQARCAPYFGQDFGRCGNPSQQKLAAQPGFDPAARSQMICQSGRACRAAQLPCGRADAPLGMVKVPSFSAKETAVRSRPRRAPDSLITSPATPGTRAAAMVAVWFRFGARSSSGSRPSMNRLRTLQGGRAEDLSSRHPSLRFQTASSIFQVFSQRAAFSGLSTRW